jgi:hypothetical protein
MTWLKSNSKLLIIIFFNKNKAILIYKNNKIKIKVDLLTSLKPMILALGRVNYRIRFRKL